MPESHDPRNKLRKDFRTAGRGTSSESRATTNQRRGHSNNLQSLPRLRSEVPTLSRGDFNSQVNTFIPRYFKHQKGKVVDPLKSHPKGKGSPQIRDPKSTNIMTNVKSGQQSGGKTRDGKGPDDSSQNTSPTFQPGSKTKTDISNHSSTGSTVSENGSTVSENGLQSTHQNAPPPPPPSPPGSNISLSDIMIRLNSLAEIPGQIKEMASDLKQMRVLQEQTAKMGQEIKEIQGRVDKIEDNIEAIHEHETETQQNQELLAKEISDLKEEIKQIKQADRRPPPQTEQQDLDFFKAKVEAALRKNNLIIEGIHEAQVQREYTAYNQARYFIRNTLGLRYAEIGMAYRLGKPRSENSRPRPLLIHFPNLGDRMDAWNARPRFNTRNDSYSIREDLPQQLRPIQAALQRVAQVARRQPQKFSNVSIRDFKIHINDTSYGVDELENLPKDLRPSVSSTPGNQQVVVFFGKESRFSNHHPSKFTIQETTYSSVEQYLADKRATLADRQDLRDKAMASDNPVEAKRVLNALHGDNSDDQWAYKRRDVLFDGLMAKFQQNEDLKKYLLSSDQRRLGEASRNKTWGIGLTLSDNGRLNPRNWTGDNLLGTTLMEVRDRLAEIALQSLENPTDGAAAPSTQS